MTALACLCDPDGTRTRGLRRDRAFRGLAVVID